MSMRYAYWLQRRSWLSSRTSPLRGRRRLKDPRLLMRRVRMRTRPSPPSLREDSRFTACGSDPRAVDRSGIPARVPLSGVSANRGCVFDPSAFRCGARCLTGRSPASSVRLGLRSCAGREVNDRSIRCSTPSTRSRQHPSCSVAEGVLARRGGHPQAESDEDCAAGGLESAPDHRPAEPQVPTRTSRVQGPAPWARPRESPAAPCGGG